MKNKIALQHRSDFSPGYFSVLRRMLSILNKEKEPEKIVIPFILTCAATLECLLNDRIIVYCLNTYGTKEYIRYANPLIFMSFRGKLDMIFPLLSKNSFSIRDDSEVYSSLKRLISLRNTLTHNKSLLEEYEAEIVEVEFDGTPLISYPASLLMPNFLKTLTSIGYKEFYRALLKIDKLLAYPYTFKENEITTKIQRVA